MSILVSPETVWFDNNGNILSNGLVYTYQVGTSTPVPTYQDDAETVLNENPVLISPFGRTLLFGTGNFRLIVKDSNGNTIYDQNTSSFLESNAISAAMAPVVSASTLALARTAMGIDSEVAAAIAAVDLLPGPQGPQGIQGNQGNQGNQGIQGPTGPSAGGGGSIWDGTGTPPVGSYIISQFQDFNSQDLTAIGTPLAGQFIQPFQVSFAGVWLHMGPASTSFLGDVYLHFYLALRVS